MTVVRLNIVFWPFKSQVYALFENSYWTAYHYTYYQCL
jgi:hypothetical protein